MLRMERSLMESRIVDVVGIAVVGDVGYLVTAILSGADNPAQARDLCFVDDEVV